MNKQDLTLRLAKKLDVSQRLANDFIDAFIGEVTTSVKKGQRVTLVGFGTFYRTKRAARIGRNPQTGMRMKIAARKVPRFRPGEAFKKAVK